MLSESCWHWCNHPHCAFSTRTFQNAQLLAVHTGSHPPSGRSSPACPAVGSYLHSASGFCARSTNQEPAAIISAVVDRQDLGPGTTGRVYDALRGNQLLESAQNLQLVAFSSDELVVLNKPFDLQINQHQDPSRRPVTLDKLLCRVRPDIRQPPYFCHRLDYCTSGCIAIAATKKAARVAGKAFERRLVHKRYIALVYGHVSTHAIGESFEIEATLVDTPDRNHMALLDETTPQCCVATAKRAISQVCILSHEQLDGMLVTRLALTPHTGRRHQLRVHCALVLGHPIVGDFSYAGVQAESARRTYLHSEMLMIPGLVEVVAAAPF